MNWLCNTELYNQTNEISYRKVTTNWKKRNHRDFSMFREPRYCLQPRNVCYALGFVQHHGVLQVAWKFQSCPQWQDMKSRC